MFRTFNVRVHVDPVSKFFGCPSVHLGITIVLWPNSIARCDQTLHFVAWWLCTSKIHVHVHYCKLTISTAPTKRSRRNQLVRRRLIKATSIDRVTTDRSTNV